MTKMVRNDLGTKRPGYEMTGYHLKSDFFCLSFEYSERFRKRLLAYSCCHRILKMRLIAVLVNARTFSSAAHVSFFCESFF